MFKLFMKPFKLLLLSFLFLSKVFAQHSDVVGDNGHILYTHVDNNLYVVVENTPYDQVEVRASRGMIFRGDMGSNFCCSFTYRTDDEKVKNIFIYLGVKLYGKNKGKIKWLKKFPFRVKAAPPEK